MIKKLLFVFLLLFQFQLNAQVAQKTSLTPLPEISMIGSAAEGWETDVVLQTTDGINYYSSPYTFKTGGLKFRQGRLWTVNWGSAQFPTGTGIQSGEDIPVIEGLYTVQFNVQTGAYSFEKSCVCPALYAPVCANGKMYENECIAKCAGETTWFNGTCESNEIKVVISGTSLNEKITLNKGGIGMMAPSPKLFSTVQNFNTGTLKFEVQEADMLYHMAAETFPSGKSTMNYEVTIPVKEGTYALLFDLETGQYDFYATPYVSIAGVHLTQVDNKGNYKALDVEIGETTVEVMDNAYGNDALMILYGNNFPEGLATMEVFTPVKVIPEYYNIYYNTNTKEYRFELSRPKLCGCVPDYKPVCANGKTYNNPCEAECVGGETSWVEGACKETYIDIFGSAVGDPVRMVFENGVYTVKNKSLAYGDVYFGGKLDGKSIQIGGNSFPTGIAEFDEKPVLAEAGEYDIVLKLGAGGNTYTFTKKSMGVAEYGNNNALATPNPVKDILNLSSKEYTKAQIYDYTGRLIKEETIVNQKIDFSNITPGNYILKIQSSANQETIKIVKE